MEQVASQEVLEASPVEQVEFQVEQEAFLVELEAFPVEQEAFLVEPAAFPVELAAYLAEQVEQVAYPAEQAEQVAFPVAVVVGLSLLLSYLGLHIAVGRRPSINAQRITIVRTFSIKDYWLCKKNGSLMRGSYARKSWLV